MKKLETMAGSGGVELLLNHMSVIKWTNIHDKGYEAREIELI